MSRDNTKIQISKEDIAYAQGIILGKREIFDVQKKDFIKNLGTIDLQAVPGSGKTLALLAKLLILERYMPFAGGAGVLVISHTNAAVDEIINKIGKHCPKLFAYPNFVGTIQAFVDQFLAIPCYVNKYRKKPHRIDDEIYEENHYIPRGAHGWLNRRRDKDDILKKSRLFNNDTLDYFDGSNFPSIGKNTATYKSILSLKKALREKGFLCYDDAYILAGKYLEKFPHIKKLLQKRFKYVFVDEMQDMNIYQHDLLEKLFYKKRVIGHVYQRIGDKNQAIYSGRVKLEDIWRDRETILKLTGSYRLTQQVAEVVKYFGLEYEEIEGKRRTSDVATSRYIWNRF
jgi:DNA helicase-2/ATP-dependent DNA helicase PcrA